MLLYIFLETELPTFCYYQYEEMLSGLSYILIHWTTHIQKKYQLSKKKLINNNNRKKVYFIF